MDSAVALRDARRRAGVSQSQLAQRAGTSQATVSAYESGRKRPSVETLVRLLAALGARIVVEHAGLPRSLPTREQQRRAGRILEEVLELAEALPTRHERELRYPRLDRAA
jgi:transcriptional regulator with XRE-family HTH domain